MLLSGRLMKTEIRFLRYRAANTNALSLSISVPWTAAGSSMPQCAVIGCPRQTGQASPAAASPSWRRIDSAAIERALFPVHGNRTLKTGSTMTGLLGRAAGREVGDQRRANLGSA